MIQRLKKKKKKKGCGEKYNTHARNGNVNEKAVSKRPGSCKLEAVILTVATTTHPIGCRGKGPGANSKIKRN
ncbi:hypothetical protein POVCU1_001780 [Plasmodium ovale curtisi]|uniref:Uncharacterized protein n=1 Tax=Plasmodium ovale curtisi TaxID=864141 RepID=A0A1A8VMQ4_PLAOA|nr:hypothetical protein POVCU1_001780 [Plasmodium ovale curtisi]